MSFEPEKFFIGIMELFSILLPGALLNYFVMDEMGPVFLGSDKLQRLTGGERVAVFLVVSYLLGHLIFLLGSWLDEIYDWARRNTRNSQIILLARRGHLMSWPGRVVIWLLFGQERNLALDAARRIKEKQLGLSASQAINTFQWCKAWLTENKPKSMAVVQRFEADSKFFRCFIIVLISLAGMWSVERKWQLVSIAALLLPLAFWRYMEQRLKSTNQAYWSIVTAFASAPTLPAAENTTTRTEAPIRDSLSHAGGVVFRQRGARVEYLLVEAKKNPSEWVLPKGHIEEGEQPRETAVREVHEETGFWARICDDTDLGSISFSEDGKDVTVQFFLMEYAGHGFKQDRDRKSQWRTFEQAKALNMPSQAKALLKSVEECDLENH